MSPTRAGGGPSLAAVAGIAAAATLVVVVSPELRFAYHGAAAHVALETAECAVGLLVAALVYGRFRASGRTRDFVLAAGLGILATTNLLLSVIPTVVLNDRSQTFQTWAPLVARIVGAVAVAAAPFSSSRRRTAGEGLAGLAVVVAATVAVIGLVVAATARWLPSDVAGLPPEASGRPQFGGHPAVLFLQAASMCLYVVAATGFARLARRERDDLMTWFAAGCVLSAFARLNYLLFPSLYSEWVYTGDVLRLGFYLMLLAGAVRELSRYWSRQAEAAVLEERRRIARDLHDGLASELFFIFAQTRGLRTRDVTSRDVDQLASAADRALFESRRAITALTAGAEQPFRVALAEVVERVAENAGATVRFDVADGVDPRGPVREAFLRIAREAATNAVRHGRAARLDVVFTDGEELCLKISDDGVGFDPARLGDGGGFGIVSMQERAASLDGRVRIDSRGGAGTVVEVSIPSRARP